MGIGPKLYCLWATLAIGLSIAIAGLTPESVTRLLVLFFLLGQVALRSWLEKRFSWMAPKSRFILMGTILAAAVEGFHMVSRPVFLSLRIGRDTSFAHGLTNYALDLLFTVPAYFVIFSAIWYFINRFRYSFWQYVIVMGMAQALGDGGIYFFAGAPFMLVFLPYPMTNYHAINVIPYLAIHDRLSNERTESKLASLAIPGMIGIYFICGAIIQLIGRCFGLGPG